jgi:2,3-diketo-5-methylthio-1-phosphopentane phosphatase
VLVDFDGTISSVDVGDLLLSRHVADRETVARLDAAYDAGTMGSRELMRWDMEVLPDDPDALRATALSVPLDPGIGDLVEVVRRHGAAFEVVSDGLAFYIEELLAAVGLDDLPVATNRNALSGGAAGMSNPYGNPACSWCGTCKRERVRAHQAAGRAVVLVGDGTSDRFAAAHADLVFAKGRLLARCEHHGWPAIAWEGLRDVVRELDVALADGRLPRDRAAYAAWRERRPLEARPFVCGPEAWGAERPGGLLAVR